MLSFLTLVESETADPLTDVAATEAFWRTLPQNDPIAAQKAMCGALADGITQGRPDVDRLRALLALDLRARVLVDALLVNYDAGNRWPRTLEKQSWQAAFELCRAFGRALSLFLGLMHDSARSRRWREHLPSVALRLFQHRQIELLLRPFADERAARFSWTELHLVYRFVQARGLLHQPIAVSRSHSLRKEESTLEREYIHVLLQDLLNRGHLPPYDAFQASQGIARWCKTVALESRQAGSAEQPLVVDLDKNAGLARLTREAGATCLCLDMAPVLQSIRNEIVSLPDVPGGPGAATPSSRGRQLKLLRKLSVLCTPERPVIARHGVRQPTASTVEVAIGMAEILGRLRNKPEAIIFPARRTDPNVEEITITVYGAVTETPAGTYPNGAFPVKQWPTGTANMANPPMTMVDRSDSGCRLHGPTLGTNRIVPGMLIALREAAGTLWTLAVVRRVAETQGGTRIDMGVEYLGSDPECTIVVAQDSAASATWPPGSEQQLFAGLYLPESVEHPVLPIKTLVLPALALAPGDRLSLRSHAGAYTIQLSEPIEEQPDFIWSPFEILACGQEEEPAPVAAMAGVR